MPPQVLCYGTYKNLLESRRMLLKALGCDVRISNSTSELRTWLGDRQEYALIVLCHTASPEECLWIKTLLRIQGRTTIIYRLEATADPEEFTLRVREFLTMRGFHVRKVPAGSNSLCALNPPPGSAGWKSVHTLSATTLLRPAALAW